MLQESLKPWPTRFIVPCDGFHTSRTPILLGLLKLDQSLDRALLGPFDPGGWCRKWCPWAVPGKNDSFSVDPFAGRVLWDNWITVCKLRLSTSILYRVGNHENNSKYNKDNSIETIHEGLDNESLSVNPVAQLVILDDISRTSVFNLRFCSYQAPTLPTGCWSLKIIKMIAKLMKSHIA